MDQRCEKHGNIFPRYEFCPDCLRGGMLAASPNAGAVSEEEFERAVIAGTNKAAGFDVWVWMTEAAREEKREGLRAALSSLGLKVGG